MNIGIISSRYAVGIKHDAGRAVYEFAQGLAEMGHRITVYTYNSSNKTMKFFDKKIKVVSVNVFQTAKAGLLFENAEDWNAGIIDELEHEDTTEVLLVFDWLGYAAADAHRKKYASKVIGVVGALANGRGAFGPFTDAAKLKDYTHKELHFLQHCDRLIAFNQCSLQEVKKLTLVPCSVVPVGVDAKEVVAEPKQGNVLVVGRVSREKCLEILLRAITDSFWISLTVCGTGVASDYGQYLQKLAKKLDVSDRVVFVDDTPAKYYQEAEIAICPSLYDPFGYSVYDAFNYKVPVIGHYQSYSDVLQNGINGFTYTSIGELSKALNMLHHSKQLRSKITQTAKAPAVVDALQCMVKTVCLQ